MVKKCRSFVKCFGNFPLIPQNVIQDKSWRRSNVSKLEGVKIRLHYQDVTLNCRDLLTTLTVS